MGLKTGRVQTVALRGISRRIWLNIKLDVFSGLPRCKSHLGPVQLYNSSVETRSKDYSGIGILLSNFVVIIFAMIEDWDLSSMMFIYWFQSVIIGFFHFFRILCLRKFCTDGFTSNGKPVPANSKGKWSTALFFAVHYGFFHLIYVFFILGFEASPDDLPAPTTEESKKEGLWMLFSIAGFFLGHGYSFYQNVKADLINGPNLGALMFMPYARVIPMHLTIFVGSIFDSNRFAVLIFSLLKTGADYLMHIVEHRVLQKKKPGDGE
ncbi:MAG: DUF6498-containing protein [Verrucomicrobiales bacterium]|nr:DUF6498-containing protein [Verrucomicrobiales bacterium]